MQQQWCAADVFSDDLHRRKIWIGPAQRRRRRRRQRSDDDKEYIPSSSPMMRSGEGGGFKEGGGEGVAAAVVVVVVVEMEEEDDECNIISPSICTDILHRPARAMFDRRCTPPRSCPPAPPASLSCGSAPPGPYRLCRRQQSPSSCRRLHRCDDRRALPRRRRSNSRRR